MAPSYDGPILSVRDLTVRYGSGTRENTAVSGVSFDVARGGITAVVGESGSGKSSTALSILGLLPRTAQVVSGSIHYDGDRIDTLSRRAFSRLRGAGIAYVPQDPTVSLDPLQRIGRQIGEVLEAHRLATRRSVREKVVALLAKVGIRSPELYVDQYPHQLSGGMRQRVLFAIALAANPTLLIADEPTSNLDVTIQKQILDELSELARSSGISVVLITHDLGVAYERADRIVVLKSGRVVEHGTSDEVFLHPTDDYTKTLITSSTLQIDRPAVDPAAAPVVLRSDGLGKTFRVHGSRSTDVVAALDDVTVQFRAGLTTAVVGESGSGKTTLARVLAGLERPTSGTVEWPTSVVPGRQAESVQYVYQNPYTSLNPTMTIQEIVTEPARVRGPLSRAAGRALTAELLESVALDPALATRRPGVLSGGQRQRIAIARALAASPTTLILDEPVSALDVVVQARILQLLDDLQRERQLTYVFISHDLSVVRAISDYVYVMRGGEVVEEGATAQIWTDPRDPYTRSLLDAVPRASLHQQKGT